MAEGRQKPVQDAVREAVERTVQATLGSAQGTRDRAQEMVDDVVKGAEAQAEAVRDRVRGAIEGGRPATQEDLRELRDELGRVADRLEAVERRIVETGDRGGPPGTPADQPPL